MESLVPYSSSSDEQEDVKEEEKNIPHKLPCAISKLGARRKSDEEEAQYSNASLHQNKIRRFKHERGNWATFVYVPVEERIFEGVPDLCQEELKENLNNLTEFHISLSRTVVLQYHWIDNFVKSLESKIRYETNFNVFLSELEVYVNEEKTRTFIGFKVHSKKLMDLLYKVDDVLEEFKLERFYKDPSFHVSFAWCLGDKSELLATHFKKPTDALNACLEKCLENAIKVDELQCKIGYKIYKFKLNKIF